MAEYKPIIIEIIYFREVDVLTASGNNDADSWLDNGNANDFDPGWIAGNR